MSIRIHLINPSHVSFGVAVITPRWLFVLAAATPSEYGDPRITDETLEQFDPSTIARGRCRRHRHPHGQRPAGIRGRQDRARPGRVRRLWRHSRHALPGRSARTSAAATPSSRATATSRGARPSRAASTARSTLSTKAEKSTPSISSARGGICCPPIGICGHPYRRCAAARNTARSVRCGRPTARNRASAGSTPSCRKLSNCGASDSGSSRLPTTTSIPVTLEDLELASRRADHGRLNELKALRAERFELMERLAKLPSDMNFFTQITMEAAEDPEFLARCAKRASRARSSASSQ